MPLQNNGIFVAWDGELSLTDGATTGFGELITVPEPGSPLLLGAAAVAA